MRYNRSNSTPTFESTSFLATVRHIDGKNKLVLNAAPYYNTYLNTKCKDGEILTMVLTKRKPKRTLAQNNYLWVYMTFLSEETGATPEDLHALFKHKFLRGRKVNVMGEVVEREGTTTNLSRLDFGEYIRKIEDFTGIQAPPTENYRI